MPTWDAGQYLKFADERTRPCRELAAGIALDSPKKIIDLGCGPGNSTTVLRDRWPDAQISGLDSSPEMIASARKSAPQVNWVVGDITAWASDDSNPEKFDIVFSNAAMQWVPDHAQTIPKLLERTAPGGALAIQVPCNFDSPAHSAMRDLAASETWRKSFPTGGVREWLVHNPPFYFDVISPKSVRVDLWETEYQHVMDSHDAIVQWYRGTGLRPFLDALPNSAERERFAADYLQIIRQAYPPQANGQILFPFRRLFMISYRT
jgi:trans-aconitate 2-methyltransferase